MLKKKFSLFLAIRTTLIINLGLHRKHLIPKNESFNFSSLETKNKTNTSHFSFPLQQHLRGREFPEINCFIRKTVTE